MNRQRSPKPVRSPGLTPQQILILVLVGLLGIAALVLAAFLLLANNPAPSPAAPVSQAGSPASTLPPTWTPAPKTTSQAAAAPAQALPALPASCAQAGKAFSQGTLNRVIDGGTLEIRVDANLLRIGYAGIDVPADGEAGQAAAAKARELLDGQTVVLVKDASDQDSNGRLLRYVFAGSQFVNYELVRQGLAAAQPNSPDQACASYLQQAEQQARTGRLGLWNPTPVPTRTFVPFVTLAPDASGCDCSKRYTCSDFKTHAAAQACLNVCNDYSSKLDEDRDGIACENLP